MDGLDASFGDGPRDDEQTDDEMQEDWTGGERLTREQSNRQGTPRSDALNASPMTDSA